MGTMDDIEKAKKGFNSKAGSSAPGPQKKTKQPWLKYSLADENAKREGSRKMLHLTSLLKEIGFPIRMGYSYETLRGMKDTSEINIPENMQAITGIVELNQLSEDTKTELLDFFKGRGIIVNTTFDFKYDNGLDVTRVVIQTTSIKEVQ